MTNHSKIWGFLASKKTTTIDKISKKLSIDTLVTAGYIRALYNAKYLEASISSSKIKHTDKIRLIKYTGKKYPYYNKKGIFTDHNTFEEFCVTPRGILEKENKTHINLIPILKAIISINKDEIYKKDIWKEADLESVKMIRWIPRLEGVKILIDTGEQYRNSKLYDVNLAKCKKLLKYVEEFKSHKLAFEKVKS